MKNNLNDWARTLLISYKYLQQLCNTIDRMVEANATSSYYNFGSYVQTSDILNVSKKLYKLINKKVDYINIKVIVDKALKNIPKRRAKYLILRYIQNLPIADIADILKISTRTIFRNLANELVEFSENLELMGYDEDMLELTYGDDGFLKSILKSVQKDARFLSGAKNPVEDFDFDACVDMLINKTLTKVVI